MRLALQRGVPLVSLKPQVEAETLTRPFHQPMLAGPGPLAAGSLAHLPEQLHKRKWPQRTSGHREQSNRLKHNVCIGIART
jgi:hypothetical protein